jgi:hypothetical protein
MAADPSLRAISYAGIVVWGGRKDFLERVVPTVARANLGVLRKHKLALDTLLRVARVKTGYADPRTGRWCMVRPATLANAAGVSKTTVMVANRVLRELGLEVRVFEGRMLDADERKVAQATGSTQRGLSSVTAFTVPSMARRVVDSRTPSRGPSSSKNSTDLSSSVARYASGMKAGAPRRQSRTDGRAWAKARRLASELVAEVGWLAGEATKRMLPALLKFARAEIAWSGADVAAAIQLRNRRLELPQIDPGRIRTRKAAVLAHLVRQIDPYSDHPNAGGPLRPCGHPDCDGTGWRTGATVVERGVEYTSVHRCPDCPPELRSAVRALPHRAPAVEHSPGSSFDWAGFMANRTKERHL